MSLIEWIGYGIAVVCEVVAVYLLMLNMIERRRIERWLGK